MTRYLYIALWIVCFYDASVMLLFPSSVQFITGTDGNAARYIVDLMALIIAGYVAVTSGFKKVENKWIPALLVMMVISHFHSPNFSFESLFIPKDMAIFNYKPMFECLAFFLMFMAISSIDISHNDITRVCKSFCWIAVIYSVYIILQHLGMDQFYRLTHDQHISQMSRNPEAGGFISQPVFAAAFLTICVPFLICNKSYWMMALTAIAIICTGNRSACVATIVCGLMSFPQTFRYGRMLIFGYIGLLLSSLILHCVLPSFNVPDTGRLEVWKNLFMDFVHPTFPGINTHYILTGHGLGSFSVFFPFYHHSGFYQAHNELFELIYTMGLGGLILAGLMFKSFIKGIVLNSITLAVLAISICAMTNPVWHNPQLAFVTVVLIGLAYNKTIGDLYVETR